MHPSISEVRTLLNLTERLFGMETGELEKQYNERVKSLPKRGRRFGISSSTVITRSPKPVARRPILSSK
jgi:hypothetical protein